METVSIKMDEDMAKKMDDLIKKHQYGTRTEFIRGAVREKMTRLEKDELIKMITALKGSSKVRTSDKELRRIRIEAGEEYFKERELERKLK